MAVEEEVKTSEEGEVSTNQETNDEKQVQLNRLFRRLKRKYPNADPVEMIAKMEKDMASYPSFVTKGKNKFFCHVQVSSDTIEWLKEVAGLLIK